MVPAVAVKVAAVEPAAIVTDAGTLKRALLLLRVTTEPPLGAATEVVTVQVVEAPEPIEFGEHANEVTPDAAIIESDEL